MVKILNSNNGNMDSLVNIPSFALKLPSPKLFKAESAVFKTASVKNTDLKSPDKEIFHFLIKRKKKKKECFQVYLADTCCLTLL